MISLHCDLFFPDGLKNIWKDRQKFSAVLFNELTFQCEIGLQLKSKVDTPAAAVVVEDEAVPANELEFGNDDVDEKVVKSSAWKKIRNLFHDGMKLLNEECLEFTVNFVIEFPEEQDENGKAILLVNENQKTAELLHAIPTEVEPDLENLIKPDAHSTPDEPLLVQEIKRILALSLPDSVELCSQGIGGTYFIKNQEGKRIAVFKPSDEEPGSECNPKGKIDDPLLPPGGGSIREVAAYVLDQGFAGVPETHLVSGIQHPSFSSVKSGSLQRYVDHDEDTDISSSRYSVDDVHKIGIIDVRLFNMDRNEENILIQNLSNPKLIPIDHSYVLPPELSFLWFEWLHWKQAKQPFSEEILSYIQSIDIQKDAATLRQLGFEPAAIRTMMISSSLLKIGALKYGYNLFQIGSLMSRKSIKDLSPLERMVKKTEEQIQYNSDNQNQFLEILVKIIETELDTKKTQ